MTAVECFVGYIVFDGWIMNVDRHHENWGMLADSNDRLAPSYDHASALGRLLNDERRTKILEGEVYRLDLEKYISRSKASGAIYPLEGEKSVAPWKLVGDLSKMGYADEAHEWLAKILAVTDAQLDECFSRFPKGWISPPAARFAKAVLQKSRQLMKREIDQ